MKRQFYYRLAQMRRWANSPNGERTIVWTWTALMFIGAVDAALLVIGVLTA